MLLHHASPSSAKPPLTSRARGALPELLAAEGAHLMAMALSGRWSGGQGGRARALKARAIFSQHLPSIRRHWRWSGTPLLLFEAASLAVAKGTRLQGRRFQMLQLDMGLVLVRTQLPRTWKGASGAPCSRPWTSGEWPDADASCLGLVASVHLFSVLWESRDRMLRSSCARYLPACFVVTRASRTCTCARAPALVLSYSRQV